MSNMTRTLVRVILLAGLPFGLNGCLVALVTGNVIVFEGSSGSTRAQAGFARVQTQAQAAIGRCVESADGVIRCSNTVGGQVIDSSLLLDGLPGGVTRGASVSAPQGVPIPVDFIDPLIVQLPASAGNFTGTFDDGAGNSGALSIQAGLSAVPADINSTITAESGMQLVVLDFPQPPPPIPGTFSFDLPLPPTSVVVKAMYTGRLEINGVTYYPPILPCTTDFSNVPTITIPVAPAPQPLDLSAAAGVQGCSDQRYAFGVASPATVAVPALSTLGALVTGGGAGRGFGLVLAPPLENRLKGVWTRLRRC